MLDKLNALVLRWEDLEAQLSDPAVYGDTEKLRTVNRELKELGPVVETYQAYRQAQQSRAEAEELLHDPEFRTLAQEELAAAKAKQEQLEQDLKRLLLPKDPNDGRNVIMELRGGSAERRARCSQPPFCVCIPCMPNGGAGSWRR